MAYPKNINSDLHVHPFFTSLKPPSRCDFAICFDTTELWRWFQSKLGRHDLAKFTCLDSGSWVQSTFEECSTAKNSGDIDLWKFIQSKFSTSPKEKVQQMTKLLENSHVMICGESCVLESISVFWGKILFGKNSTVSNFLPCSCRFHVFHCNHIVKLASWLLSCDMSDLTATARWTWHSLRACRHWPLAMISIKVWRGCNCLKAFGAWLLEVTSIKGYWVPSHFAARGQHSELQNQQKHLRDKGYWHPISFLQMGISNTYYYLLDFIENIHLYRNSIHLLLAFFLGGGRP